MSLNATTDQSPQVAEASSLESPIIECHELPAFHASDLAGVRRAFARTQPLWLRQAWRLEQEPDFAPGLVRIGWQDEALLVFAELTDMDIFTNATSRNERLWELGDSFEIFLRPVEQMSYFELQVAPNNCRLQLSLPDSEAVGCLRQSGSLAPYLPVGEVFQSATWVQPEDNRWLAFASIPAASVCERAGRLVGSRWRFSFGRYDFTRGRGEPIVSSTSPHTRMDFHRQHEWRTLQIQPRL